MEIKDFFHILFLPKKDIKDLPVTFAILKSALFTLWYGAQIAFYVLSIILLATLIPDHHLINTTGKAVWIYHLIITFLAALSFVYAQICRIAKYEAKNIKDKDYCYVIFGAIASLISTIIAITSIL